jgi:single-strand DNA-binding protein
VSFTNNLTIDGNLVRDGEVRFTNDGKAILSFSIAHNEKTGDKETVHYFDITVFGKHAEYLADAGFAKKGNNVLVAGRLVQQRWEKDGQKRSAIKIIGNQCSFGRVKEATAAKSEPPPDDDIPF